MMTVREFMSKKVLTVSKEASIVDAAKLMTSNDVGALMIVTKDKRPEGIITERDILKKIVAFGRDASIVKVKDIMVTDITSADEDMSLMQLSKIMHDYKCRRMPVTKNGKLVGIVTSRDLVKIMSGN